MSTPKVTVCLPTYNRSEYLSQTLASVLWAARKAMIMKAAKSLLAETPWWIERAPMFRASHI